MPHQVALTIRAAIRPGRHADLLDLLPGINRTGAGNRHLPLAERPGPHSARLFVQRRSMCPEPAKPRQRMNGVEHREPTGDETFPPEPVAPLSERARP